MINNITYAWQMDITSWYIMIFSGFYPKDITTRHKSNLKMRTVSHSLFNLQMCDVNLTLERHYSWSTTTYNEAWLQSEKEGDNLSCLFVLTVCVLPQPAADGLKGQQLHHWSWWQTRCDLLWMVVFVWFFFISLFVSCGEGGWGCYTYKTTKSSTTVKTMFVDYFTSNHWCYTLEI